MTVSRRNIVRAGVAASAVAAIGGPRIARAQAASPAKTLRAVMQGDLRVFDPIWTTANITAYHGAMIYDTLFALDGNFRHAAADGRQIRRLATTSSPTPSNCATA